MNTKPSQTAATEMLVWSCVEDGFYVATVENTFLGFVDRVESDVFQVCNARSEQVGLFDSLEAAKQFLITQARDDSLSTPAGKEVP